MAMGREDFPVGFSAGVVEGGWEGFDRVTGSRTAPEQCSGVRKRLFVFGVVFGPRNVRTGPEQMFGLVPLQFVN